MRLEERQFDDGIEEFVQKFLYGLINFCCVWGWVKFFGNLVEIGLISVGFVLLVQKLQELFFGNENIGFDLIVWELNVLLMSVVGKLNGENMGLLLLNLKGEFKGFFGELDCLIFILFL